MYYVRLNKKKNIITVIFNMFSVYSFKNTLGLGKFHSIFYQLICCETFLLFIKINYVEFNFFIYDLNIHFITSL